MIADKFMSILQLFPPFRALILVALPKVVQSVFSALSDFYTWKFAEKIYGQGSNSAWSAVRNFSLNSCGIDLTNSILLSYG